MKRILFAVVLAFSASAHARVEVSPLVDDRITASVIADASQSVTIVLNSMYPNRTTPIPINEYKSHAVAGNQNYGFRMRLLSTAPVDALAAFEFEKSMERSLSQKEINDFINSTEIKYYKQIVASDPNLVEFIKSQTSKIQEEPAVSEAADEAYWQCGEIAPQASGSGIYIEKHIGGKTERKFVPSKEACDAEYADSNLPEWPATIDMESLHIFGDAENQARNIFYDNPTAETLDAWQTALYKLERVGMEIRRGYERIYKDDSSEPLPVPPGF